MKKGKKSRIVPMSERTYRPVPLDRIDVLNSRNRDQAQFDENVRSIDEMGQLKPVVVTDRNLKRTGRYELVCGEGRMLAHQRLGKTEIMAEVCHCDRKQALLISLAENIARVPPGTMAFAREMKRMRDAGFNYARIGRIVGKCQGYVSDYIRLVEQGEDRLIKGVEQGLFSMSFAAKVAKADDAAVQNILMDAFDEGMVNSSNLARVRKLIELRTAHGKSPERRDRQDDPRAGYRLSDLKRDITRSTKEKEDYVRETRRKENRLLALLMGLRDLEEDEELGALLGEEGIGAAPPLSGKYDF